MVTVETRPNRFPVLIRAREWVRDSIRGFSDKDLQDRLAVACGHISDDYRESFQTRLLERAYLLGRGPLLVSTDPTYNLLSSGAVGYLQWELKRFNALTPKEQDDEIIQDTRRWLQDHHFPVSHN